MSELLEVRCEYTECDRNANHKCLGYFGTVILDEDGQGKISTCYEALAEEQEEEP